MKRLRFVVQARMGSRRLPGKILAPLAGRPSLEWTIRRIDAARERLGPRADIVLATTEELPDTVTAAWGESLGVKVVRGSTDDCLGRFLQATRDLASDDVVVRITADNPLYCPRRTVRIVTEHVADGLDYSCVEGLSFVVPEVVRVGALREVAETSSDPYDHEHVTPAVRRAVDRFRTRQWPADSWGLRPDVRLTLDEPEDLERVRGLLDRLAEQRGPMAPEAVCVEDVYCQFDGGAARSTQIYDPRRRVA